VYSYQWERSPDGLTWSVLSGASQTGFQEGVLNSHQYYRRSARAGICPPQYSDSIRIWVDPPILNNQIMPGQTICLGDSTAILTGALPSGGNGLFTYLWQSSFDNSTWQTIPGETQIDLSKQLPVDTTYYRRGVTSRFCQSFSNSGLVITNLLIGSNVILPNQTLCSSQVPGLFSGSIPTGGNGIYNYQWQSTSDLIVWNTMTGSTQRNLQEGILLDSVWYRRLAQAGPCPVSTSATLEVIVFPPISNAFIQSDQTICAGNAFTILSGSLPAGGSGSYTYQWLSSQSGTNGPWLSIAGSTGLNLSGFALTQTSWFRRIVNSGGVCRDSGNVVRVLVNSAIQQNSIASNQTICLGSPSLQLTGTTPTGGNGIYIYSWESSTDALIWQTISGQVNRDLPPIALAQSHYFRRLVASPPCPVSTSAAIQVTVDMPIGSNTVAGNQTICTGSVPALISGSLPSGGNGFYVYQWQSSLLSSNWQNYIPGQTNRNLQPPSVTQTFLVRRLVQAGVCRPDTSAFSRIEVEQPIGNNTVLSSQTVCQGVFPQLLSGTLPSGGNGQYSYGWQSSAIPFNWVPIAGETDADFQPPFPVTASYYRRIVQAGFCPPNTSSAINLDYVPQIGDNIIFADQTICYAQQPGLLTGSFPSGGSGFFGYEWQMSIDNINWAAWGGGTQQNLNTGPMVFPLFFRRVVGSGSCNPNTSNVVYVHVFAPLGNNVLGGAQTICSGGIPDPLTGTLPTGGTGSYTYQWQSSSNGISGWVSIPGQTSSTYVSGVMTQSAYFRRQIISGLCQGLGNGNTIRIFVLPVQSIGNNFITPAQSLCLNDVAVPLTGTIPTGGTGAYVYEWLSSNDLNLWQSNIASSRDYVPPALTASIYYRRIVRTGTCRPDTTSVLPILVFPRIGLNQISGNQTLCRGSIPALLSGTQPSGGTGLYIYRWEVSSDSLLWQAVSGGTQFNYQSGALMQVQYYRRIVFSSPCTDTSNTLTLFPVPTILNNTIVPNQTLCNGLVPFLLTGATPGGGTGLYQFQWQSGSDGITWFNMSGGTQNDCNPGVLFANTYFRRIVISLPCTDTSQVTWVTVWPMLGNNWISPNQTLCSGQTPALLSGSIPSGGNGTMQYEWHESVNQQNWQVIAGGTSQNLQFPVLSNTQYFRRIISSAGCPSDTTQALTVEVYPGLVSNIISASQTICQGNAFSTLSGSIPVGGNQVYAYQWFSSLSALGPWVSISGATAQNYAPGVLNQTTFVRRFVTSGGVCADTSNRVELRIIPRTSGNSIGSAQTICSGSSFQTLTGPQPSGGTGGWNYSWQYSHDAILWTDIFGQFSASLSGYPLTSPMYFRRIAASWPCVPDTSAWVRISVDLPVSGNFIQSDQTICRGQIPVAIFGSAPQQGNGQYNYQWESGTGNGVWNNISGATASGCSSGPLFNTIWFRRRVVSGVCNQSLSDSIRILVLPAITGNTIQSNQTICLGQVTAQISGTQPSGGNQAYQIQWYQQPLTQSVWLPISGQQWNDLPPLPFAASVRLRRVVTSGNCVDSGNVVTIVVNPGIGDHFITSDQTLCQGALPALLTGSLPTGGNGLFNWQWETSPDGFVWQALSGGTQATHQPGIPNAVVFYRRLAISAPCPAVYSNAIQLSPLPVVGNNSIQGNQTICSGNTPTLISGSMPTGGNSQYIYLWQSSLDHLSWITMTGSSQSDYQAGVLTQSVYYRRLVTSQPCQDTSASVLVQVNPTPQLFISDTVVCSGDSVLLQAVAVPSGGIFTWNVPPFNAQGVWVKPNQNTTYAVDYGFNGCFTSEDVTVLVLSLPAANIDFSGSLKICAGASLQLNYNGTNVYQWLQNGNILASNTPLLVSNAGTYNLRVTDGNGCMGMDTVILQQGSPLLLQPSSTDPSCAGGADGTASVGVSGGYPPYQYLWSNGQQTPTVTGLAWGTYQVLVEDSEGCLSNQQVVLFSPNALMIQNIQTIPVNCFSGATGSASVNVTGGTPPYQYFWNSVPPQNTANAIGLKAGTYSVRIVDAQGCQTTGTAVIGQPGGSLSANIIGPDAACPGDSGVIRITALGGTAPYQYEWSPSTGLEYSTEMVTRVYFNNPITYTVKITDNAGCVLNKNYTLPVLPVPQARFSILYETPDSILRNETPLQIRNYSTPLPLRYWWDFGDSTGIDSIYEPVYKYFITDTYKITLMVENTYGCRDTAYQWVDYRNVPFIHFPNAFSPNGDGVNDYFSIPSLNLVGFSVKIFDRWGNMVYLSTDPAFRWDGALAGTGLPEGAYTFYFSGSGINAEKIEASGVVTLIR
jgi:gliding motility-associated-like protein